MALNFRSLIEKNQPVSQIPQILLHSANQQHFLHLITKNSELHKILEEIYNSLRNNADKIGEQYIALGGELIIPSLEPIKLDLSIEKYISDCYSQITIFLEETKEINTIKSQLSEIQETLIKAKYLVRMK